MKLSETMTMPTLKRVVAALNPKISLFLGI